MHDQRDSKANSQQEGGPEMAHLHGKANRSASDEVRTRELRPYLTQLKKVRSLYRKDVVRHKCRRVFGLPIGSRGGLCWVAYAAALLVAVFRDNLVKINAARPVASGIEQTLQWSYIAIICVTAASVVTLTYRVFLNMPFRWPRGSDVAKVLMWIRIKNGFVLFLLIAIGVMASISPSPDYAYPLLLLSGVPLVGTWHRDKRFQKSMLGLLAEKDRWEEVDESQMGYFEEGYLLASRLVLEAVESAVALLDGDNNKPHAVSVAATRQQPEL